MTIEHTTPGADVLVVTSGWPHSGHPEYCVFIKRQMDSLLEQGFTYEALFIHGYRSSAAYLRAALRILGMNFRRQRYRLVHAHGGEASLVAHLYRRAPVIVSYLGGDLLGNSYTNDGVVTPANRLRRTLIRQSSRLAGAVIIKSREMEDALPGPSRTRSYVVPNGVDMTLFRPIDRVEARATLNWDENDPVAIFVADPTERRKRYELAVSAVEAVRRVLPKARLEVVNRVDPDRTPLYMNAADCLLHVSRMEGSPNVVKEALMCNLPVVATAVGDIPELLADVDPSFLVTPTIDAIADALLSCLGNPRRSNGRARSGRLASEAVARRIGAIYGRVG